MNKPQHARHKNPDIAQSYEILLNKIVNKTDSATHKLIDTFEKEMKILGQLTTDEILNIEESIKRDLRAAKHYLVSTSTELKDWLGFDLNLIKAELWLQFSLAADKTTLELLKIKDWVANPEYHSGEIIGLGTLICDQCDALLHFHHPGHIPPCAKCHGSRFHRISNKAS